MRVVYRIALARHARDLSGQGARLNGGRWNNKGAAIIYTSESRSLAAMEYLVHVSLPDVPAGLKIVSIGIPAAMNAKQVELADLPRNWHEYPPPFELADLGTKWVERAFCFACLRRSSSMSSISSSIPNTPTGSM
jgi:RES domain-containing protein